MGYRLPSAPLAAQRARTGGQGLAADLQGLLIPVIRADDAARRVQDEVCHPVGASLLADPQGRDRQGRPASDQAASLSKPAHLSRQILTRGKRLREDGVRGGPRLQKELIAVTVPDAGILYVEQLPRVPLYVKSRAQ